MSWLLPTGFVSPRFLVCNPARREKTKQWDRECCPVLQAAGLHGSAQARRLHYGPSRQLERMQNLEFAPAQ
jgi:hypothetical protein